MARILVIDNDDLVNEMIVQLMTENGYDAEGVSNGKIGLEFLSNRPFDLIVTDIVMPEKEGLETILEIRKRNKEIPIVAISGAGKLYHKHYLQSAEMFGADRSFQ